MFIERYLELQEIMTDDTEISKDFEVPENKLILKVSDDIEK